MLLFCQSYQLLSCCEARRAPKPSAAIENVLFSDLEGGQEMKFHDDVAIALKSLEQPDWQEPWVCRASEESLKHLFGSKGLLKSQLENLRCQFTKSSLRFTDGKAMMPVEFTWETLRGICASITPASGWLEHLEAEQVGLYPNLAKASRPMLFAFAAGVRQAPRFETGGVGKLRLSVCGSRRVWLVNGSTFQRLACGEAREVGELQNKLSALSKKDMEALAKQDKHLFQWVRRCPNPLA